MGAVRKSSSFHHHATSHVQPGREGCASPFPKRPLGPSSRPFSAEVSQPTKSPAFDGSEHCQATADSRNKGVRDRDVVGGMKFSGDEHPITAERENASDKGALPAIL
ncbi:hypothetical protein AAFF_G00347750 [Aldrovandia affinis]|uniref:Uncharacterized protein n=1 Tax=Aldrovandia affinis TaxID=143900 RepID=A0AAD7SJP9_9TELE|nr:hypothetical protein AAFF_G00347750 [Aldrovandia affinis]